VGIGQDALGLAAGWPCVAGEVSQGFAGGDWGKENVMSMSYVEANAKGRERLRTLVSGLSDENLALSVGDGWTVGSLLAHLAFWDYRVLVLIRRWKAEGIGRSPIDIDGVNDATKPLFLAIPGPEAARLALSAADAVDVELENLPESLRPGVDALVQEGKFRLNRALHRNEHLDQIEWTLGKCRGTGTA
jgi:hypothetical protein